MAGDRLRDCHVLDHPATQGAHLGHPDLLSEGWVCNTQILSDRRYLSKRAPIAATSGLVQSAQDSSLTTELGSIAGVLARYVVDLVDWVKRTRVFPRELVDVVRTHARRIYGHDTSDFCEIELEVVA